MAKHCYYVECKKEYVNDVMLTLQSEYAVDIDCVLDGGVADSEIDFWCDEEQAKCIMADGFEVYLID